MLDQYLQIEQQRHPWADKAILKKIVADNLRMDENYYNLEDAPIEDPFAELGDDSSIEDPFKPEGRGVEITITTGTKKPILKEEDDADPFPLG